MLPEHHWLLAPAFELWGSPVSLLELIAVLLSVAMVIGNLRVRVWAWPLAIAASAGYLVLFGSSRLYGEAGLQGVFIGVSIWGWLQWRRDTRQNLPDAGVRRLLSKQRLAVVVASLALWPALGFLLDNTTDSDVPYADALATVASITGQLLLVAKRLETWWVWIAVNLYSIGLFAYKALWLTAVLYGLFAVLSWWGLRTWQARLTPHG